MNYEHNFFLKKKITNTHIIFNIYPKGVFNNFLIAEGGKGVVSPSDYIILWGFIRKIMDYDYQGEGLADLKKFKYREQS